MNGIAAFWSRPVGRLCVMSAVWAVSVMAQPGGCDARPDSPSVTVSLPAHPFAVAPSRDGCWVFVSLMGDNRGKNAGIAILKSSAGRTQLLRVAPLRSRAAGIVLTHDGKLLIAAALDEVIFLDVQRMTEGAANPVLGSFSDGENAGSIYANVTADDKLLFVSDERTRSITVIDLERARKQGYQAGAIIGKIPVGNAPIALTFSPDGKWLYTTSEGALSDWKWPKACVPEGQRSKGAISNPEGAVIVVDVARAGTDPAESVVARIPAGCSPVRMAISPGGERIYVTARNSNAVLAFDAAKLVTDGAHARLGMGPVGEAPVPVAVVDGGKKVIAGNSNRFGGSNSAQSLTVLDAAKIPEGSAAVLGSISAGAFPREMRVSADGRTLFLTNFASDSLQILNVERLAPKPAK